MIAEKEIKGYVLQEVLGEGGFGAVYRAYQPLVKREVAIKVILPRLASQPEFVRRFEAEAQLIARLEHLHIVPLYDYWRDLSGAYLVMRMLRGGNLETSLRRGELWTLDDVVTLVDQIASALHVAHQNHVIHRDLKPANILLDDERNGFLSDFGIATDFTAQRTSDEDAAEVVGTPAYITPEQIQSGQISPQTDIYSFGMVIFELLTGRPPFVETSSSDFIVKHLTAPIPKITSIKPNLPAKLDDVFAIATAKAPEDRFPDVLSFAQAFKRAVRDTPRPETETVTDDEFDDLIVIAGDIEQFTITSNMLDLEAPDIHLVNPYKGLRAFQEGDSSDFYGREDLIRTLLDRLQENDPNARFLAVVGPSGSGKSSVVKAGVIPALRHGALPHSEKFFITEMVPSVDAMVELENAIMSVAIHPPTDITNRLRASHDGLHHVINEILPRDNTSEFFILIDQFEEVFTQTEDNAVRVHFIESLRYAVTHPESRMRAAITIRADFYDKPLLYPEFGALVRSRTEVVLPLSKAELHDTIVKPAENAGAIVEDDLITAIINDVNEEPGTLPLLQYALTELFERRTGRTLTLESYQDSGGVLGSLARRAEELYEEMDDERREAIRQLFMRLVTLGEGTEDTRRRVLWSELAFQREHDDPLQHVLNEFGRYRLLTFDSDPQTREPTVEVAHEALIRQWQRLRDWLENSREDIRAQRRLSNSVNEWKNANEDVSFLADGVRLTQFEMLRDSENIVLTGEETAYIRASVDLREAKAREEAARQAREEALRERVRRVLMGLVAVLTVGMIIAGILAWFAFQKRNDALDARDAAERKAQEVRSLGLAQVAGRIPRDGDTPFEAITLAMESVLLENPPAESQRTLTNVVWQPGALHRLTGHTDLLWSVAYSPDGSMIASTSSDQTIRIWDAETGQPIQVLNEDKNGHTNGIVAVNFSPDNTQVVTGSWDTNVVVWNLADGTIAYTTADTTVSPQQGVYGVAFTPDGEDIIITSEDSKVYRWHLATNAVTVLGTHDAKVYGLSVRDNMAMTGSFDATARLWDLTTGTFSQLDNDGKGIFSVALSPDHTLALTGTTESVAQLWDVNEGTVLLEIADLPGSGWVRSVNFSPDGSQFLITIEDHLLIYDTKTREQLYDFQGHDGQIRAAAFNLDGTRVATASADKTVIIWDVQSVDQPRAAIREFTPLASPVDSIALSADRQFAFSGSRDGLITQWEIATGTATQQWAINADEFPTEIFSLASSPVDNTLASGAADGSLILWNTADMTEIRRFAGFNVPVRSIAFSPDGTQIIAAGGNLILGGDRQEDNTIRLWDVATGNEIRQFTGHIAPVHSVAFSPDGTQILSGAEDGSVSLWKVEDGTEIRRFTRHSGPAYDVTFSPDGSTLLTGGHDTRVIWWDKATGTIKAELTDHQSPVRSVAFSPDGTLALSGSGEPRSTVTQDYSIHLWDLQLNTVESIRQFKGHAGPVYDIEFVASGQALSAAYDGQLILWQVQTLDELIGWVYDNYDVYCYEGEGFANDKADCISTEATTKTTVEEVTETPVLAMNAEGQCRVSLDPTVENRTVSTTDYQQNGPYTIGFSNAATPYSDGDALVGAWIQYWADQNDDIAELVYLDATAQTTNPEEVVAQQVTDIEALIEQDVDLIIVNPTELGTKDQLIAPLQTAMEKGIPVVITHKMVNYTSGDGFDDFVSYVAPDYLQVGCVMAQELVALLDGEGTIMILSGINLAPSREWQRNGALAVFNKYPGIDAPVDLPTNYDPAVAIEQADKSTSRLLRGMWAYPAEMGLITEERLLELGLPVLPAVTGQSADFADFMRDQGIEFTQVWVSADAIAQQTIATALSILKGEDVDHFVEVDFSIIQPEDGWLGDFDGLPEAYWPDVTIGENAD
ncbi:MAG: protein kinase [Anaerolineae bacterium]|nr:protein kinase [Anaerolineae bacterium]